MRIIPIIWFKRRKVDNILNIEIKELYQKLGGEKVIGDGQIMVRSLWREDKKPSMSMNTHNNEFNDKVSGISGGILNMAIGKSGKLTRPDLFEASRKIKELFGLGPQSRLEITVKKQPLKAHPEWQSWDLTRAWHGLRNNFVNAFHGDNQLLIKGLLRRYFGDMPEKEIGHFASNYNIGFTQFYIGTRLIDALAIPYTHLGRVTYIDLISFDNDQKYIVAYPLEHHRKHKEHIKLNKGNIDFDSPKSHKVFSKFRIASSFFDPELNSFANANNQSNGNFSPFDNDRLGDNLLICEGVKDAMIATRKGLNAITFQGGAMTHVSFNDSEFLKLLRKRSSIGICFDNDEPGRTGAMELKTLLSSKGIQNVNIVDLSDVCRLKGEDLADYFLKYKGDAKTLIQRAMGANS
jgi:hypothetical protein